MTATEKPTPEGDPSGDGITRGQLVTAAAGYAPVYKGKFHCVKPANGSTWVPSDVNQYGFTRWDPPDAGANQSAPEEGGGNYNNDGRYINSQGTPQAGTEGALQYLE